MERYQSGDTSYCKLVGHTMGLIRTWENDTIVAIDCGIDGYNHKNCGFADTCEMYQQKPIGYHLGSNKTFVE
jgi:hypothetical protein